MTSRSRFAGLIAWRIAVQRDGLVLDVEIALEPGVSRNQKVRAVHLDAVTGVIDHGHVGIGGDRREVAHRTPHLDDAEIPRRSTRRTPSA